MVSEARRFNCWRATYLIDNNTEKSLPINLKKSLVESSKARLWVRFFSYCFFIVRK